MYGVVDRFEDDFAVLEMDNGNMINVPISQVSECAREGDVLIKNNGKYEIDRAETKRRKKEIQELTEGMWDDK